MGLLLTLLVSGFLWVLALVGAFSDPSSRISGMLTVLLISFALVYVVLTYSRVSGTAR
jgi:hypothetical protein